MISLSSSVIEIIGGRTMSVMRTSLVTVMRTSLVILPLLLVSGCGSESGFKETLEVVVDEKVVIKSETGDPQNSLHKSHKELLSLISASCDLPHRIQESKRLSADGTVAVSGGLTSATREYRQAPTSSSFSDGSSDRLGFMSQKATTSSMAGGKVESSSTLLSAMPLTPLTPEMLRELDVDLVKVGDSDLNSHMAFHDYLSSKHNLQSKAGLAYRKVSMSAKGNGSEESVVHVLIADQKLNCKQIIIETSTSR